MVRSFIETRMKNPTLDKDPAMRQERLVNYLVTLFDKMLFALPSLCMKEMVFGFIADRNMMFLPHVPSAAEIPDSIKLCEQRGFRMVSDGRREKMELTINRLKTHSYIFFSMHLSDAYIGRLFIMLSTYLNLKFTQNSAQVILNLLEIAGDRLHSVYKKAFLA